MSRGDDRKVLSGIMHVLRYGLRWVDAVPVDGPYKTLSTVPTAGRTTVDSS